MFNGSNSKDSSAASTSGGSFTKCGLSRVDIDSLLSTLFHISFRLEEVTFRNWRDVEKYESTKCDFEDGWTRHVLNHKGNNLEELVLHYKDPIEALTELFSSPSNLDGFKLKSASTGTYSTPKTGEWWKAMEDHVNCKDSVIAGLILYSDQTSLSNDRRVLGYPIIMSLANIPVEKRASLEGHQLIAILPVLTSSGRK